MKSCFNHDTQQHKHTQHDSPDFTHLNSPVYVNFPFTHVVSVVPTASWSGGQATFTTSLCTYSSLIGVMWPTVPVTVGAAEAGQMPATVQVCMCVCCGTCLDEWQQILHHIFITNALNTFHFSMLTLWQQCKTICSPIFKPHRDNCTILLRSLLRSYSSLNSCFITWNGSAVVRAVMLQMEEHLKSRPQSGT